MLLISYRVGVGYTLQGGSWLCLAGEMLVMPCSGDVG